MVRRVFFYKSLLNTYAHRNLEKVRSIEPIFFAAPFNMFNEYFGGEEYSAELALHWLWMFKDSKVYDKICKYLW